MAEKVMDIQMDKLVGFRNRPFQVKDDESLNALCESIRDYGVLSPLLSRPTADGNYEIVSGHRRKAAAMKLGLEKLPVLVREMTDDEAIILMVDSNIQRENLLPSEKAYAYKMKLEALKHQGARNDLTSCQVGTKFRSDALVASDTNESARTIQRYIRLTYLQKPITFIVKSVRLSHIKDVENLKKHFTIMEDAFGNANISSFGYLNMLGCFSFNLGTAKQVYEKTFPFIKTEQSVNFPQVFEQIPGDYGTSHVGTVLAIANAEAKTPYKFNPAIWIHT